MFIARNTYEVAILAYFEQIGLEKHRGGPPHSSYSRGNIAAMTKKINNTVLKKVGTHIMNAWIFSEGMCCWHHNNLILSFPTFAFIRQPHIFMLHKIMSKMNMYTPCNSYYMASLFTSNSTTMMHVFCLLKLNTCFSLQVNKKLNNAYYH